MRFTDTLVGIDNLAKIPAEASGGIKGHTTPGAIGGAMPNGTLTIAKTTGLQAALDLLQDNIDAIDPQLAALTAEDVAINLRVDGNDTVIATLDGRIDANDTAISTLDGRVDGHDADIAGIGVTLAGKANLSGGNVFTGTQTLPDINTNFIDYASGQTPSHQEGRMHYDSVEKSMVYMVDETDVRCNFGRELWARVKNVSGSTILNGKVVRASGAEGGVTTIELAQANTYNNARVLGVATHDIEHNSFGYVTILGEVHDLNTAAFTEGDAVYLSHTTPGNYSTTQPPAPNIITRIGVIQAASALEGKLLVHPHLISSSSEGIVDATAAATANMVVKRSSTGGANFNEIGIAGDITVDKTITTPGTTGQVTINKNFGSVNFAGGVTSLTVINNRVTPNSIIITSKGTNLNNSDLGAVVPGSGQFTIYMDRHVSGECRVNFMVLN